MAMPRSPPHRKSAPSLIILDLGLPVGDGFVVLDRLQNSGALAAIPVIVLSARDPQNNEEKALKAGAAAFFQKPADNDEGTRPLPLFASAMITTAMPTDIAAMIGITRPVTQLRPRTAARRGAAIRRKTDASGSSALWFLRRRTVSWPRSPSKES